MARTYKQLHPQAKIIVLESGNSIGGVWASERMYPGLKTNNFAGTYENPDYPMTKYEHGAEPEDHIPGPVVHAYLHDFASRNGLAPLIRFAHEVVMIQEQPSHGPRKWNLMVSKRDSREGKGETVRFLTDKLVLAVGVTAYTNLPNLPGLKDFGAPVFHSKDFSKYRNLLQPGRRVIVYGGAKSAWDAVYAYTTAGVQVDWVIRSTGRGPCWMLPPWNEDGTPMEDGPFSRLLTIFSPHWWQKRNSWLSWFLFRTTVGRLLVTTFWSSFENTIIRRNGYNEHPEVNRLKPWSGIFWAGTSISLLNYPTDFFEEVRSGRARIYHADIESLGPEGGVNLADGTVLHDVNAIHCSTGWKPEPSIKFSPPELAIKLGMPWPKSISGNSKLTAQADEEILSRFPVLRDPPNITPKCAPREASVSQRPEHTPYRLFRYSVPPSYWEERSICLMGAYLSVGQAIAAQCQALWISAYFDNSLPMQNDPSHIKTIQQIEYETELAIRFHRLRTPAGCGSRHAEFTFETIPFLDLFLNDLGLNTVRKPTWRKHWTEAHRPGDYQGLVDDWASKQTESLGKLATSKI